MRNKKYIYIENHRPSRSVALTAVSDLSLIRDKLITLMTASLIFLCTFTAVRIALTEEKLIESMTGMEAVSKIVDGFTSGHSFDGIFDTIRE